MTRREWLGRIRVRATRPDGTVALPSRWRELELSSSTRDVGPWRAEVVRTTVRLTGRRDRRGRPDDYAMAEPVRLVIVGPQRLFVLTAEGTVSAVLIGPNRVTVDVEVEGAPTKLGYLERAS